MRIGFLGGGNMANALIGGLVDKGVSAEALLVADPGAAQRQSLQSRYGVAVCERLVPADLQGLDALVIAVKPQQMQDALQPLAGGMQQQLVLSIAAGIPTQAISGWLGGHRRIVRAMPNTPALIGAGVTGLHARPEVDAAGRALAEQLMAAVGQVQWFADESSMDAVTALSGSGPAYFFLFIESLQQAGEAMGMSADQASAMAIGTALGAAQLAAQSGEPVSVLRERVTSKGGTTEAALDAMRARQVPQGIVAGVLAAQARGRELAAVLSGGG